MSKTNEASEISLFDIGCEMKRHKKTVLGIILICALLGFMFSSSIPKQYNYTQAIVLPNYFDGTQLQSAVNTSAILDSIQQQYWPVVVEAYNKTNPMNPLTVKSFNYQFIQSKNNYTIIISTLGTAHDSAIISTLNQDLFGAIKPVADKMASYLQSANQAQIQVYQDEIPQLSALRSATENYVKSNQKTMGNSAGDLQALRDIYITSLGASNQQGTLVELKLRLANLQASLSSLTGTAISPMVQVSIPHASKLVIICIAILVGIVVALFYSIIRLILRRK